MKIFKSKITEKLPEVIRGCQDRVFIVYDDGKRYPVNENEAAMRMFEKYWEDADYSHVELICESVIDSSKLCRMLFSYI